MTEEFGFSGLGLVVVMTRFNFLEAFFAKHLPICPKKALQQMAPRSFLASRGSLNAQAKIESDKIPMA